MYVHCHQVLNSRAAVAAYSSDQRSFMERQYENLFDRLLFQVNR